MLIHTLLATLALSASPDGGQPRPAIGAEVEVGPSGRSGDAKSPEVTNYPLKVGVVSVLGPKAAKADSERIVAYLAKALGRKMAAVIFTDYDELANAAIDEKIDFAWMPPLQGFNAKLGGATLAVKLLRGGAPNYRSVIFTRADSPFTDLASVHGAKVGWVDRNSSTGYLFPLATVARAKLSLPALFKEQTFLGNHEAVCRAVESKQVDVGATLADEPPAGKELKDIEVTGCQQALGPKGGKLKVLAVSEPVPNDVLVLRRGLDVPTRNSLTKALLAMTSAKDGKALLKDVFKADGVAEVQEGDFDPVQHALEAASGLEAQQ